MKTERHPTLRSCVTPGVWKSTLAAYEEMSYGLFNGVGKCGYLRCTVDEDY